MGTTSKTNSEKLDLRAQNISGYKVAQHQAFSTLDASDNPIQNFGFLSYFSKLKNLFLSNANVAHLSQIPPLVYSKLLTLDLSRNNISSLHDLPPLPLLESLDLSSNPLPLGSEGAFAGKLPSCRSVLFKNTPINGMVLAQAMVASRLNRSGSRTIAKDDLSFGCLRFDAIVSRANEHTHKIILQPQSAPQSIGFEPVDICAYVVNIQRAQLIHQLVLTPASLKQSAIELALTIGNLVSPVHMLLLAIGYRQVIKMCVIDIQTTLPIRFDLAVQQNQMAVQSCFPSAERLSDTIMFSNSQTRGNSSRQSGPSFLSDALSAQSAYNEALAHFDTRVQFSQARQGEWLRIIPATLVKTASFYQTLLTFNQIVHDARTFLEREYGELLPFPHAAELMYQAMRAAAFFEGDVHMRIRLDPRRLVTFKTPFEKLVTAQKATQVLCQKPDKVVFAEVETSYKRELLVSAPVDFQQDCAGCVVELAKERNRLAAVFYSPTPGEPVQYVFRRNGTSVQMGLSPFFDLDSLENPGGSYSVDVVTAGETIQSAAIQLNNFKQIKQLSQAPADNPPTDLAISAQSRPFAGSKAVPVEQYDAMQKQASTLAGTQLDQPRVNKVDPMELNVPVASPAPPSQQDLEEQFKLLHQKDALSALQDELAFLKSQIAEYNGSDRRDDVEFEPAAEAPEPLKYKTAPASKKEMEQLLVQSAYDQLQASLDDEIAQSQTKGKSAAPTAREKLERNSKEVTQSQKNAPLAKSALDQVDETNELRRLQRLAEKSDELKTFQQASGKHSQPGQKYKMRYEQKPILKDVPHVRGVPERPLPIVHESEYEPPEPKKPKRGSVAEMKQPDSVQKHALKKPSFKPVVAEYYPASARLQVSGMEEFAWDGVHTSRSPGLTPSEAPRRARATFDSLAPKIE